MTTIATILVALVAVEHLYILYIEMFAWTTIGKRVFKGALPDDLFEQTKGLAANQGLYNGFLSAGLLWSLTISDMSWARSVATFFLFCVVVAATYGAWRSKPSILLKQGLPAIIALAVLFLGF